ncbi:MAG: hypothetical protein IJ484_06805 [Oscillospiraceae bacterium]|nr:hypothetical protein [Oscillospiraceae bacterium]
MSDHNRPQPPPVADHWPEQPAPRWAMQATSAFKPLRYPLISLAAHGVEWQGPQGAVRTPAERTLTFASGLPFTAAGRPYLSLQQLSAQRKPGLPSGWYLDCYGRVVYRYVERFSCFDDCDGRSESRYYRWYFLFEQGRLTRIQHTDGTAPITVTEDAAFLEDACLDAMREDGCPHCL